MQKENGFVKTKIMTNPCYFYPSIAAAAAGMVSQDRTIFLSYETVGDVDYLTLTDESED